MLKESPSTRLRNGLILVFNLFAWFWHDVERERERLVWQNVHADLYAKGWTYQLSFYGTTTTPYDGRHYQARIEVMSRLEPQPSLIVELYEKLSGYMPDREYTLFLSTAEGLKQVLCR